MYDYCPHCHIELSDKTDASMSDAEWQRVLEGIYNGDIKPGTIDAKTATDTAQQYVTAIQEGLGFDKIDYNSPDYGLLKNLERNCYQFAGAKNYQTLRALNDMLRDGERLRTFNEFKNEAVKALDEWNGVWMRTEYNTAVNSAINARKWDDFSKNVKTMPLLQFKIVRDERTCPICLPFADMVRPMTDSVWNYAMPPLHFGDRCTILQLPDANTPVTEQVPSGEGIPELFRVNLAKEQLAFPPKHPYYKGVPKKQLKQFLNTHTTE